MNSIAQRLAPATIERIEEFKKALPAIRATVKFYDPIRGFGFTTTGVFFRWSAIAPDSNGRRVLYKGDLIEFAMVWGKRGPEAIDITLAETWR